MRIKPSGLTWIEPSTWEAAVSNLVSIWLDSVALTSM
jgi:hypothetical protein